MTARAMTARAMTAVRLGRMPSRTRVVRPAASALLVGVLVMSAVGCGGEAGPIDDGTYSSLQAGAPALLDTLGVTVVSLDQPRSADPNDVDAVLASRRLDADTYAVRAVDGLALDPEEVAGLLGMAGNVEAASSSDGRFVVLCFDRLEAAIVFAQSDPVIFADAGLESDRSAYFSGNLVAYYARATGADARDRLRAALEALAGT